MPGVGTTFTWPDDRPSRIEVATALFGRRYDYVIDLQNNLRSRFLTRQIATRKRLRFHRTRINRFLRIRFPSLRDKLRIPDPVSLQYLNVAARLGAKDDGEPAPLISRAEWLRDVQHMLERIPDEIPGGNGRLFAIAPGSLHPTKTWPVERWQELLSIARKAGFTWQIIVGSNEDRNLGDEIRKRVEHKVHNLCGMTELGQFIGLLSRVDILICGDSGPMHIAAGLGTPLVAIFGPTVPEFGFAPFRAKSIILQNLGLVCRPCKAHGSKECPRKHFRCMRDIDSGMVIRAAVELLNRVDA